MPKLGFGLMRLPENDGVIDHEQVCRMVDDYMKAGMNYFDTAYVYHGGKSEVAAREALPCICEMRELSTVTACEIVKLFAIVQITPLLFLRVTKNSFCKNVLNWFLWGRIKSDFLDVLQLHLFSQFRKFGL